MNRRLLQQTIGSVGPAGFLLADDSEMYERNQRGVQALRPGVAGARSAALHRERHDENGHLIGDATDEVPQRAIWQHYRALMEAARERPARRRGPRCCEVEQFLYREARLADEHDYDAWEALWTDDAVYWVPAGGTTRPRAPDVDHLRQPRRASRSASSSCTPGKRHSQTPPSSAAAPDLQRRAPRRATATTCSSAPTSWSRVARARHHDLGGPQRVPPAPSGGRAAHGAQDRHARGSGPSAPHVGVPHLMRWTTFQLTPRSAPW